MQLNKIINKKTWFDLLCFYESGRLNVEFVAPLFQFLLDHNIVWQIQGYHGATAIDLIEEGVCVYGEEPFRNAYGMTFPSRHELHAEEPGTVEYQKNRGYNLIVI